MTITTAYGNGLRALARASGRATIVSLAGEFDAFGVAPFESMTTTVDEGRCEKVVADLSRLEFIDSAAVCSLARWAQRLQSSGSQLLIRRPPPLLLRIVEVVGDTGWLQLEEEDEAPLADVVDISLRLSRPS